MHNLAAFLENNTDKLPRDFDRQMDNFISARRPDLIIINKKKKDLAELWTLQSRLTTEWNLEKCEKKNKYRDLIN